MLTGEYSVLMYSLNNSTVIKGTAASYSQAFTAPGLHKQSQCLMEAMWSAQALGVLNKALLSSPLWHKGWTQYVEPPSKPQHSVIQVQRKKEWEHFHLCGPVASKHCSRPQKLRVLLTCASHGHVRSPVPKAMLSMQKRNEGENVCECEELHRVGLASLEQICFIGGMIEADKMPGREKVKKEGQVIFSYSSSR